MSEKIYNDLVKPIDFDGLYARAFDLAEKAYQKKNGEKSRFFRDEYIRGFIEGYIASYTVSDYSFIGLLIDKGNLDMDEVASAKETTKEKLEKIIEITNAADNKKYMETFAEILPYIDIRVNYQDSAEFFDMLEREHEK